MNIYIYIYIHVCIERKRWGFPTAMFDYWRRLLTKPTSFKPRQVPHEETELYGSM